MIFRRRQLLEFYDVYEQKQAHHISGVTGFIGESLGRALLLHKFRNDGFRAELVPGTPTTGQRKGSWLDCWIAVSRESDRRIYQVEIKNWSAYSKGGLDLLFNPSESEYQIFAKRKWDSIFDGNKISNEEVAKVLIKMKLPLKYSDWQQCALVCFWFCLHPEGKCIPHFSIRTDGDFAELEVFSMSAYLRSMTCEELELETPWIEDRLVLVSNLFRIISQSA